MTSTEYARSKRSGRGISADMSPEAIEKRFDILVQLNELCGMLATAERIGKVEKRASSDTNQPATT